MAPSASGFVNTVKEGAHNVRLKVLHVGGEKSAEGVMSAATKQTAETTSGLAAGAGVSSIALVATLGVLAAVSAFITQLDYGHRRRRLADFYKEEIAAKLGKKPDSVGENDLEPAAAQNATLAEQLQKYKKQRNYGVGITTIASVGTYALVHLIPHAAFAAFGPVGAVIASAVVGLAVYQTIKKPLHWLAHKAFGLDNETAHDRIADIQKDREAGKTISREQVFSAFVAASPELEAMIKSKYGKPFDQLDVAYKLRLTESIGQLAHIDDLTKNLNLGHINVGELAFAVHGQESGVLPKNQDTHKPGLMATIKGKLGNLLKHASWQEPAAPVEYDNAVPERSFAARVGRKPAAAEIGHAERVEQARAAEQSLLTQR